MIGRRAALVLLVVLTRALAGQDDASELQAARHQMALRHLDSALTLLQVVHDNRHALATQRATAFVLDGVVRFYQGKDSLAARAFRSGLALDSATVPPLLVASDSALGALWFAQVARMAAPSYPADTVFTCLPRCVGLDEAPSLIGGFDVSRLVTEWGADRNQYGRQPDRAQGTLRLTVDTMGRVEPGSAEFVSSTLPRELVEWMLANSLDASFSPGKVRHRAVRVRIEIEIRTRPFDGR
jgi:hypothetical protein